MTRPAPTRSLARKARAISPILSYFQPMNVIKKAERKTTRAQVNHLTIYVCIIVEMEMYLHLATIQPRLKSIH